MERFSVRSLKERASLFLTHLYACLDLNRLPFNTTHRLVNFDKELTYVRTCQSRCSMAHSNSGVGEIEGFRCRRGAGPGLRAREGYLPRAGTWTKGKVLVGTKAKISVFLLKASLF